MAFSGYASRLRNAAGLEPYLPFLKGESSVVVTVKLFTGGLYVEEGPDIDGYEAEVKNLKRKVEEQEKEIKSLNILLEKQKPIEEQTEDNQEKPDLGGLEFAENTIIDSGRGISISGKNLTIEGTTKEKPKKSKRKRKKKASAEVKQ